MINKKLGIILFVISLVLAVVLSLLVSSLQYESEVLGCFPGPECQEIQSTLDITHFAFGIVGFILALSVYLMFFYTGEKDILRSLENQKKQILEEERFNIIMSALDEFEKKVLKEVKNQEGIKQSTLVLRTGLSKSKISDVLKQLESKKLLKRLKKGKNNFVHCLI